MLHVCGKMPSIDTEGSRQYQSTGVDGDSRGNEHIYGHRDRYRTASGCFLDVPRQANCGAEAAGRCMIIVHLSMTSELIDIFEAFETLRT